MSSKMSRHQLASAIAMALAVPKFDEIMTEQEILEVTAEDTQFSIVVDYGHDNIQRAVKNLTVAQATKEFKEYVACPAAKRGDLKRVAIVDGSDYINAEWQHGKGIVFPAPTGKENEHESP